MGLFLCRCWDSFWERRAMNNIPESQRSIMSDLGKMGLIV